MLRKWDGVRPQGCVFQEVLCMGPSVASGFSRQVIFGGLERCVIQSHLQVVSFEIYFGP